MREVILICGPPGAGKSTRATELARALDLVVYDSDDPRWKSERAFRWSISRLGRNPNARAVVIRTGATRSARASVARAVKATRVELLAPELPACIERLKTRGRTSPPLRSQIAGAQRWWAAHLADRREEGGGSTFANERFLTAPPVPFPSPNQKNGRPDYGTRHQALRAKLAPFVASGQAICARCRRPIPAGAAWDLGHVDGDPTSYAGPEHIRCNRATAGRAASRRRRQSRKW